MKRFFLLLLAALLIWLVGSFFVVHPRGPDLLDLVPADSLAVMDWDSPAQSYQAIMDTPFGEQLRKMNRPLLLSALGFGQAEIDRIEETATAWEAFSGSLLFREIFGRRTVLALLADKDQEPGDSAVLSNNLVLLNTSGRKVSLVRSFIDTSAGIRKISSLNYRGKDIQGYLAGDRYPFYLVTENEFLIAAFDPAPIRQCLDLLLAGILQKHGGMANNPEYMELKKRTRGLDDFFFYVDLIALKHRLRSTAGQGGKATTAEQSSPPESIRHGVRNAVLYHQSLQPVHQFTSIVRFDASVLPSFQQRIYLRPPVVNRKLANMPANLQVYFWSNWLDLPAWWQETKANASGRDIRRADRLAAFVTRNTGMSMEEFLRLFGHQIGLNIKEIKSSGFFPVPRICFCVEIADHEQVRLLLEKMVAELPVHRGMIAGVPVVSVQAAGGLMQPSYALLKKFLLLADGRDQIEDVLQPTEAVLIREPDFLELDMGLLQPNNLVFFARTAQVINGLKELASWLGTIIAIRDEEAAARSKVLIDQGVVPLLDGLNMVRATAVRSYTGKGEIVVQSTVLMADN